MLAQKGPRDDGLHYSYDKLTGEEWKGLVSCPVVMEDRKTSPSIERYTRLDQLTIFSRLVNFVI